MNPQWEYALEMVKLGFWVFPLADGGKMPRATKVRGTDQIRPEAKRLHLVDTKGRGGFHAATNDVEIVKFWANELPLANFGVACGKKYGVTVIDLDRHGDIQDGVEVVRRWAGERDSECRFWVTTPSNGIHLYYKAFTAQSRTVVSGVECQNWGRYVAGPCCKTYKGMYVPYGEPGNVGNAPEWLEVVIRGKYATGGKTEKLSLLTCIATFGFVPEGYRHDAIFIEAVHMVAEDRADEDIFQELRTLVDTYVVGGDKFPDDELRRNIRNAKRNMTNDEGATRELLDLWGM